MFIAISPFSLIVQIALNRKADSFRRLVAAI